MIISHQNVHLVSSVMLHSVTFFLSDYKNNFKFTDYNAKLCSIGLSVHKVCISCHLEEIICTQGESEPVMRVRLHKTKYVVVPDRN